MSVINNTCNNCNIRIPNNRPILICCLCKEYKHYKCNNLSKNEAWELIRTNQMGNWSCQDCFAIWQALPQNYIDEPLFITDRPIRPPTTDGQLTDCPTCNRPCSTFSSKVSICSWCDRPCHNKCFKKSLGCTSCCNDIIPGYNCEAYQLNGAINHKNSSGFNPYTQSSLINQIGSRIENEEEAPVWAEIASKLNKCKYIDAKSISFSKNSELKTLSLNVRSLSKSITEIRENIDSFQKFDVLCFCETGIDVSNLPNGIDDITIDGFYNPLTTKPARDSNKGGGLAVYVNHRVCNETDTVKLDLNSTDETAASAQQQCEFMFVKLSISMANSSNKKAYIIGNFYRSPSNNPRQFLEQMDNILVSIERHSSKQILLVGDFNIDLIKHQHDPIGQQLIDLMARHGFVQVINRPTRITDHSMTLIDHIYTNKVHNMISSGVVTYDISDHLGTSITFTLNDDVAPTLDLDDIDGHFAKFDEENLAKFRQLIEEQSWDDVLNESDAQQKYSKFAELYTNLYSAAFPQTTARRKRQRASPKPWILPWLEEACHRKNLLFFVFVKEPSAENKAKYENMKNFVDKHIKLAKRKYYKRYFEQYSSNSRKQWQMLNSLLNRKSNKKAPIKLKDSAGNQISDPLEVAENFNNYFATIAEKLKGNIDENENVIGQPLNDYKQAMTDQVESSIFLKPTFSLEISNIINSFKLKATSDTNIKALKIASTTTHFNDVLADIVNSSFASGVFPTELKIAKVVPIHKGGSKTEVSNYRPISLLSTFSKIFEKAMHTRVYDFLQHNGSLNEHQYGFRKGRSCEHALLVAQNELLAALDKKQIAMLLLIDFSKAFDMVNHDILLDKLNHYGIRGIANEWFKSYLKNREQYVNISGKSSTKQKMKHGVPQGSILGPLLFIIYINDLPNICSLAKFILYADDANIIITADSLTEIETIFRQLSQALVAWVGNNELLLNTRKTNYMIFTRRRNISLDTFVPKMGSTPIERKSVAKFLGVLVDDKLSWKRHISAVKSKMSRYVGTLYKLKHILPVSVRLLTFNSLVQSHTEYCSSVWGCTNKSKIDIIFITQKKAMRAVMPGRINYFYKDGICPSHTKQGFTEYYILTVQNIILKNLMILLNKAHNYPHLLPRSVRDTFHTDSPNPTAPTDYTSEWYTTYNRTPYNNTVFFKGPLLYTQLMINTDLIKNGNPNRFKNTVKSYLHKVQSSGNETEWSPENFKLNQIAGLRQSARIRSQPAVNYSE